MLSKIAFMSLDELKFVAPRIMLYTALAYVTVRAAGIATDKVATLMGIDTKRTCC